MNIPQLVDDLWKVHTAINADYLSNFKEQIEEMYDDGLGALIEVCQYIVNTEILIDEDDE